MGPLLWTDLSKCIREASRARGEIRVLKDLTKLLEPDELECGVL